MTGQKGSSDRPLLVLGAAIALPMILASGPLAGFVIGQYVLVKYVGMSSSWVVWFVVLGFIASGIQTFQLIRKIQSVDSKRK